MLDLQQTLKNETQTDDTFVKPSFDDILIVDFTPRVIAPAIWHIETEQDFDEEEILEGDWVRFEDEKGRVRIGQFINLWQWSHKLANGEPEPSPIPGDTRVMAYIKTQHGTTYADVTTITLCDDYDDFDFIFGMDN